jgi:lipoprotein-anchoring transpeptidase ErfK/SrfK
MSKIPQRTPSILVASLLGLVVLLAIGIYIYDRAHRDQIAKGVRIDGIDVGGLSASAATARLQHSVASTMERPVTVSLHEKTWLITPREARVVVDVRGTISQALDVSKTGSIFTRTYRNLFGGNVTKNLPLHVIHSRQAVTGFAAKVAAAVNVEPRNATVEPTASGLTEVSDRVGMAVEQKRLTARVTHALSSPFVTRSLLVPTLAREPSVTTNELATRYPAYIVVNREQFRLYFYEHLQLVRTYEIAVGMQGLETTPGLYHIQWKQTNPPWYVPNSAWAGSLAGKTIPPGPADPLKARFMSFNGGAGIHGIAPSEYSSIGHDASHGCVRMRIPDVIALYAHTPVGTPVYVI